MPDGEEAGNTIWRGRLYGCTCKMKMMYWAVPDGEEAAIQSGEEGFMAALP